MILRILLAAWLSSTAALANGTVTERSSWSADGPIPSLAGSHTRDLPPTILRPTSDSLVANPLPEPVVAERKAPTEPKAGSRTEANALVRSGLSIRCTYRDESGRCDRSSYAGGYCHIHQPDEAYRGIYFADLTRGITIREVWLACGPRRPECMIVVPRR